LISEIRFIRSIISEKNSQNDRLNASAATKEKAVGAKRTRTTFNQLLMMPIGVSKLGLSISYSSSRVKVSQAYYRDVLYSVILVVACHIRQISDEFICPQDITSLQRSERSV